MQQLQKLRNKAEELHSLNAKKTQSIKKYDTFNWHLADQYKMMKDKDQENEEEYSHMKKRVENSKMELQQITQAKSSSHSSRKSISYEIADHYMNKITNAPYKYSEKSLTDDINNFNTKSDNVEQLIKDVEAEIRHVDQCYSGENRNCIEQTKLLTEWEIKEQLEIMNLITLNNTKTNRLQNDIDREIAASKNYH